MDQIFEGDSGTREIIKKKLHRHFDGKIRFPYLRAGGKLRKQHIPCCL